MLRRKVTKFLIGSDPECFIINTKTNKVKSAISLVPGTKEKPHCITELGKGYAVQTDNILAEFNIPPANNKEDFVSSIIKMQEYIKNSVKEINSDYDILCASSQIVPKGELRSKQAKLFGCDPDYCVYTGKANAKPKNADTTQLRSAGFHVHVGYTKPTIETSIKIIKYLDAFLGLPSVVLDTDTERRKLYGKAGCFRLCKYGLEYRTLSSFFMSSPDLLNWVWDQTVKALNAYNSDSPIPFPAKVEQVINDSSIEEAKVLCDRYNIFNFKD